MRFPVALLLCAAMWGTERKVAITIDDLPRGGDGGGISLPAVREMTARLLQPFRDRRIPVIGFVNDGRAPDIARAIYEMWLDAGAELGNHTFSHPDFNTTPLARFEADIVKGEGVLRPLLEARGKRIEFFRHPFLHAGKTLEDKRELEEFLKSGGYRVAPVTFDNSDYMFAALYTKREFKERVDREYVPYLESVIEWFEKRSVEVVGREFPQIMLLHASELNSRKMPEILAMFERRGYAFVSLKEALRDEVYSLPENYAGPGGFSWIHRWAKTKGVPARKESPGEPDEPEWVRKAFQAR
ncbi:MAG TPA: polysaccharide deacetylase family protein [Bryobacteraceae bacterium]|nr:polysaccharide deacetylase family protein [Bryobacteraceae bacterium]